MPRVRVLENPLPVRDTFEAAKKHREDFFGAPIEREEQLGFAWPRFVRYLGRTNSEIYLSNKKLADWRMTPFKHICEADQYLFVNPDTTLFVNDDGQSVDVVESKRRLRPPKLDDGHLVRLYACSYEIQGSAEKTMPRHVAKLAKNHGVQWIASNGRYFEAHIPNSFLAAAEHPVTHETMLIVYSKEGIHFLITGPELDVTKDGIVG